MADEYTPTTEQVRAVYMLDSEVPEATGEAFDRWLAAHDREVAAKALQEAADEAQQGFVDEQQGIGFARVRTDWLRERADRIELQASEKGTSDGEQ